MKKNKKIEEIIRIDQAGELGAIQIYKGQLAVLKNKKISKVLLEMLEQENRHYSTFNKLIIEKNVRPTLLNPIWKIGAYSLGVITAIMGPKCTMACTEAVEEVIIKHYEDQTNYLKKINNNLYKTTSKFAKEEKDHMDVAKSHDTGNTGFHKLLKIGVRSISKAAIKISEKI